MQTVIEMEQNGATPEEIYEEVRKYFRYNVKHYFCCTLNRPELYGRIEDSLVYYNYIGKEAVGVICKAKISSLIDAVKDKYKLVNVDYSDEVMDKIVEYCQTEHVRSMGARGIGKAVNMVFEGSLANFLKIFVTYQDNHTPAELEGASLHCELVAGQNGLVKADDLVWSIV